MLYHCNKCLTPPMSGVLTRDKYRQIGVILNEYLDFNITSDTLCNSASRALGSINSKIRNLKDCNYKTYSDLCNSGVSPVLNMVQVFGVLNR